MKAYLFWYLMDETSTTEYVYVIAVSHKQAKYFWFNFVKHHLGFVYDYDIDACNEIDESQFTRPHEIGDILGQEARI